MRSWRGPAAHRLCFSPVPNHRLAVHCIRSFINSAKKKKRKKKRSYQLLTGNACCLPGTGAGRWGLELNSSLRPREPRPLGESRRLGSAEAPGRWRGARGRGPAGWLGGDTRIEGEEEQAGQRELVPRTEPGGRAWLPRPPLLPATWAAWAAGSGRSLGACEFVLPSVTWAAPTSWGFATAE